MVFRFTFFRRVALRGHGGRGRGDLQGRPTMPSPSRRRYAILLFLLTLSLLAVPALAAGPAAHRARPAEAAEQLFQASFLGRAWNLLAALWAKEGCHIDPNGRCAPGPTVVPPVTAQGDTGCNIDPN